MNALWPLLTLLACGGGDPLTAQPGALAFGDVDFQQPLPPEGYAAIELSLENHSKKPLTIAFPGFPTDRLVLSAQLAAESPPTLFDLDPEARHLVQIGVSAYELGERDTLVEGTVRVIADGDTLAIPFSYTPVRLIDGDSGL